MRGDGQKPHSQGRGMPRELAHDSKAHRYAAYGKCGACAPTVRADRDLDLAQIVATMKSKGQTAAGEREQLKATLKECLTTDDVEEFISADTDRAPFFSSKAKGIASSLLNPQNRQVDLSMQVAERIYEIRCKIVHTKAEHDDGEFELLLPYSAEAERLGHDIDLVRFVAQKVLVTSSRRLEIAA